MLLDGYNGGGLNLIFEDEFGRVDANPVSANDWTGTGDGAGPTNSVDGNNLILGGGITAFTSWVYRNKETYDATDLPSQVDSVYTTNGDNGYLYIGWGAAATNIFTGTNGGVSFRLQDSDNTIKIFEDTVQKASESFVFTNGDRIFIKLQVLKTGAKIKAWLDTDAEPIEWTAEWNKGSAVSLSSDYLNVGFRESDGNGSAVVEYVRINKVEG